MPRITEATKSPNKMIVSSPNRAGKCVAPGGEAVVPRDVGQELAMSIKRARLHPTYRYGAESNAQAAQRTPADTSPMIRRLTRVAVSGRRITRAYCSAKIARTPPYAAPNPAASLLLRASVAFAAITATRKICTTRSARCTRFDSQLRGKSGITEPGQENQR